MPDRTCGFEIGYSINDKKEYSPEHCGKKAEYKYKRIDLCTEHFEYAMWVHGIPNEDWRVYKR